MAKNYSHNFLRKYYSAKITSNRYSTVLVANNLRSF